MNIDENTCNLILQWNYESNYIEVDKLNWLFILLKVAMYDMHRKFLDNQ
jgi:hypothetical protein